MNVRTGIGIRKLDRAAVRLHEKRSKIDLRVFLGGPFINPALAEPDAALCGGATRLRYRLFKFLSEEMQCSVDIGESEKLLQIYKEQLEDVFEASTTEFIHVRDICDAVIIIPSSPGSFCELGYFSASNVICSKMLIILDRKYDEKPGYLHVGPVAQAKLHSARVVSVDFDDFDDVSSKAAHFLNFIALKTLTKDTRLL